MPLGHTFYKHSLPQSHNGPVRSPKFLPLFPHIATECPTRPEAFIPLLCWGTTPRPEEQILHPHAPGGLWLLLESQLCLVILLDGGRRFFFFFLIFPSQEPYPQPTEASPETPCVGPEGREPGVHTPSAT